MLKLRQDLASGVQFVVVVSVELAAVCQFG